MANSSRSAREAAFMQSRRTTTASLVPAHPGGELGIETCDIGDHQSAILVEVRAPVGELELVVAFGKNPHGLLVRRSAVDVRARR